MNTQDWSPLGWTGWISLQSKGVFSTPQLFLNTISTSFQHFQHFISSTLLKNLLQHHSSKTSILQRSAFFTVQLLHPYMTTGKTIALTRQTFVDKVMSLLLNMLSRLVITFLPRSKRLLISWLQSPSDFGASQNSLTLFPLFPHLFPMKWWDQMPWSSFSECWALSHVLYSRSLLVICFLCSIAYILIPNYWIILPLLSPLVIMFFSMSVSISVSLV